MSFMAQNGSILFMCLFALGDVIRLARRKYHALKGGHINLWSLLESTLDVIDMVICILNVSNIEVILI